MLYGNRTGNWPGMIQRAADLGLQAGEDVNPRARRLEAKERAASCRPTWTRCWKKGREEGELAVILRQLHRVFKVPSPCFPFFSAFRILSAFLVEKDSVVSLGRSFYRRQWLKDGYSVVDRLRILAPRHF